MTRELRAILDKIDTVLAKHDDTAAELWNVLTALRGPDSSASNNKSVTTVPIRRVAFPLTARVAEENYGYLNGAQFGREGYSNDNIFLMNDNIFLMSELGPDEDGHFRAHVEAAGRVLEIGFNYGN